MRGQGRVRRGTRARLQVGCVCDSHVVGHEVDVAILLEQWVAAALEHERRGLGDLGAAVAAARAHEGREGEHGVDEGDGLADTEDEVQVGAQLTEQGREL